MLLRPRSEEGFQLGLRGLQRLALCFPLHLPLRVEFRCLRLSLHQRLHLLLQPSQRLGRRLLLASHGLDLVLQQLCRTGLHLQTP